MDVTEISGRYFDEERALFGESWLRLTDCTFGIGESPLKECNNIDLNGCFFRYKYPLWYTNNVNAENCYWFTNARAGVWYCDNVSVDHAIIEAPKNFRRCSHISLTDVNMPNAQETLWNCKNVKINKMSAKGDYFAMNCENLEIDGLDLVGNYSFDGVKNMTISNSRLLSRDAFWNSENITVKNSFISGEYLGWNSKNLTLENCTVQSLQGMCYIENLVMKNCKLVDTTLAFEFSSVDADIKGNITSVLNPSSGTIRAESITELVIQPSVVDKSKTQIICNNIGIETDTVLTWPRE